MKVFEKPVIEIMEFNSENIVTNSVPGPQNDTMASVETKLGNLLGGEGVTDANTFRMVF